MDSRHAPQAKEGLSIDSETSKECSPSTIIQKTVKASAKTCYGHLETALETTISAAETDPREIT